MFRAIGVSRRVLCAVYRLYARIIPSLAPGFLPSERRFIPGKVGATARLIRVSRRVLCAV